MTVNTCICSQGFFFIYTESLLPLLSPSLTSLFPSLYFLFTLTIQLTSTSPCTLFVPPPLGPSFHLPLSLCLSLAFSLFRTKLTSTAEKESIAMFVRNLRQRLLACPVRGCVIMGVDPGFRHGCKLAILSPTSKWQHSALDSCVHSQYSLYPVLRHIFYRLFTCQLLLYL